MEKVEVLRQYFGFSSFREGQQTLIDAVLAGRDVLGVMPLILLLPGLLGLSGVAMSQPAADFLTFLVSILFQIWFFRHKLRG